MKVYNDFEGVKRVQWLVEDYTPEEEDINLKLYTDIFPVLMIKARRKYDFHQLTYREYVNYVLTCFSKLYGLESINDIKNFTEKLVVMSMAQLKYDEDIDFGEQYDTAFEMYMDKNKDYNNSSEKQIKHFGHDAFYFRLTDKISRLVAYDGNLKVKDEKLQDTILDLINYCMIYLIHLAKAGK